MLGQQIIVHQTRPRKVLFHPTTINSTNGVGSYFFATFPNPKWHQQQYVHDIALLLARLSLY